MGSRPGTERGSHAAETASARPGLVDLDAQNVFPSSAKLRYSVLMNNFLPAGRWVRLSAQIPLLLAALWLVGKIVTLGSVPLPEELGPPRTAWDFASLSTPGWRPTNANVVRTREGLRTLPERDPPVLSSGPIAVPQHDIERIRLNIATRDPAEGRFGLVFDGPSPRRTVLPFYTRGGGVLEDIVISIPDAPDALVIQEAVLVPSVTLQPATVASIRFEGDDSLVWQVVDDLISIPGHYAATRTIAINTLPPPTVAGRPIWTALTPLVLLVGVLSLLVNAPQQRLRSAIARTARITIVLVWVIGASLLLFHQAIAFRSDWTRFGNLDRDSAYRVMDHAPLWSDFKEAQRWTTGKNSVAFVSDRTDIIGAKWKGRIRYYAYPMAIRDRSPVRLHYFGKPHPACPSRDADWPLLHESERFCLWEKPAL